MSQFDQPDNPTATDSTQLPTASIVGGGGDNSPPPEKGSRIWLLVTVVVIGISLLAIGTGIAVYLGVVGFQTTQEKEVAALIENDSDLVAKIGELKSLRTIHSETNKRSVNDVYIYRANGTRDSLILIIRWIKVNDQIEIKSIRYRDSENVERPISM